MWGLHEHWHHIFRTLACRSITQQRRWSRLHRVGSLCRFWQRDLGQGFWARHRYWQETVQSTFWYFLTSFIAWIWHATRLHRHIGKFGKSICRCHYCSPTVPLCHVTECHGTQCSICSTLPIPHQEASLASLWDHFVPLAPRKSANETLESQEFERHGLRLK